MSEHFAFIQQYLINNKTCYWMTAILYKVFLSKFPSVGQISQTYARLKDTFEMSYKRIKIQKRTTLDKQSIRRFAFWSNTYKIGVSKL